jgi:hypothetical protein
MERIISGVREKRRWPRAYACVMDCVYLGSSMIASKYMIHVTRRTYTFAAGGAVLGD